MGPKSPTKKSYIIIPKPWGELSNSTGTGVWGHVVTRRIRYKNSLIWIPVVPWKNIFPMKYLPVCCLRRSRGGHSRRTMTLTSGNHLPWIRYDPSSSRSSDSFTESFPPFEQEAIMALRLVDYYTVSNFLNSFWIPRIIMSFSYMQESNEY